MIIACQCVNHVTALSLDYNLDMTINNEDFIWVATQKDLHTAVSDFTEQDILAVDTESNSLYAYQERVCLLQFSTRESDYLIDPLAIEDISSLAPIFSSKEILKVFHAAEYDLICLFRDFGFRFNYLFDTMVAARTLGYQKIGLASLLEKFFGVKMNKRYQRANWGQRPLKPDMLRYARLDSHYLIPIQAKLRQELIDSGRWPLALEDFDRLTKNIEDTTETNLDDFWKLRGARDLSPKKAAILKALYQYRDHQAKHLDRPPFKVVSHQALVEIAQTSPNYREELDLLPSLSTRLVRRFGRGLMQAVRTGKEAPPEYPPHTKRPEEAVLKRIDSLREWRKLTGRDLGVPSDVVLPRDVLNRIAWDGPESMAGLESAMKDVPYRYDRFGGKILDALNNGGYAV